MMQLMRYMRITLSSAMMFLAATAMAQEVETPVVADSLAVATPVDSVAVAVPQPVRPVHTLGHVSVIDTLPTENEALRIILFNDNTWRYVLTNEYRQDSTVFNDHWSTSTIHAYSDVELESLPEAVAIQLVDSLQSYHYPYVGKISSRYGPRRGRSHQGIDLPLKTGDPIYAAFDGKVRVSKSAGDYGNLVIIRHNNGLETYYAHLSVREVEPGDWVVAGQQIGQGGNTGRSTGPHLHFTIYKNGVAVNPQVLWN